MRKPYPRQKKLRLFEPRLATRSSRLLGGRNTAFPLKLFASEFTDTPDALGLLTSTFFGGLFKTLPKSGLPEYALALQLLFQKTERLFNVVVTYQNLHF
uniref:Uncharacterized protein n=1 Tax=Rhizobium leguminosarum TaxID=384 RepID=A0A154IGY6_RHILE|nr:hypothetical protein A4A59_20820 [Rhizobium leguminosarum]